MYFQCIITLWLILTSLESYGMDWDSSSLFTLCLTMVTFLTVFPHLENGDNNGNLFYSVRVNLGHSVKAPSKYNHLWSLSSLLKGNTYFPRRTKHSDGFFFFFHFEYRYQLKFPDSPHPIIKWDKGHNSQDTAL